MNKISIVLWTTIIVLFSIVIDYNFSPQHYIYAYEDNPKATLWVVNDGWRSQPFITTPETDPYLITSFIDGREVLYKMPLQKAPYNVKVLNNIGIMIIVLLSIILIFRINAIIKKKLKFEVS